MALLSEQLAQETRLLEAAWAIASRDSARIAGSDFNAAAWSCIAWIARSDFDTAAWSGFTRITSRCTVVSLELALEPYKLALDVALESLEGIENRSANFAAARCYIARIAGSDLNAAAWCCVAWSDFDATAWSCIAWSDFNATAWISNDGITAGAASAHALATEQAMEKITTEALRAERSTDNQRTNNDIPFHLSQISLSCMFTDCCLQASLRAVERRPISAHEVAAEIALWRGFYVVFTPQ